MRRHHRPLTIDELFQDVQDRLNGTQTQLTELRRRVATLPQPDRKREHRCPECGVGFARADLLVDHRSLIHEDAA